MSDNHVNGQESDRTVAEMDACGKVLREVVERLDTLAWSLDSRELGRLLAALGQDLNGTVTRLDMVKLLIGTWVSQPEEKRREIQEALQMRAQAQGQKDRPPWRN